MLFFDRKPPSDKAWTDKLWIYDFRTDQRFTPKTRALARSDFDEFVSCYNQANRHERTETERFRAFTYDEIIARDKASLDIWPGAGLLPDSRTTSIRAFEYAASGDLESYIREFAVGGRRTWRRATRRAAAICAGTRRTVARTRAAGGPHLGCHEH